jgi:hypothetical protein
MLSRIVLLVAWAVCGFSPRASAGPPPPKVDERWAVTVNGQTIRVDADGSFRLPNIAAADLFGATGPGSPPDFKSDEWFQVVGTATIDGVTWYAYSEPFQITSNPQTGPQTYKVLTLPVTRRAPADIPESVAIEVVTPLQDNTLYVGGVGGPGSTPIRVWANFAGMDDPREITTGGGTTYRTSNRRVVDVEEAGGQVIVTARGIGTGFVTATNRGATAVQRFVVTTPCMNTLLVGRVVTSGGSAVPGAIVSTEGGSNAPTGTNGNGEFSFHVCYTPGTPFSVVVVGPAAGQKAVLTDVTPVPDGVTDVGTITLESNFVFWNIKQSGNWNVGTNWHTNSVPTAASHVFVNIEDRLPPPWPDPYRVTLNMDTTISDFTLDSPHAVFTTCSPTPCNAFPQRQFTVTGESTLLAGTVEWRQGAWLGGSLFTGIPFSVFGNCFFGNGLDVVNNGLMRVEFDSNAGVLTVQGTGTTFTHASTLDDLVLEGELHILQAATLTTTPDCKGITIGTSGLLEIREPSANVPSVFNHNGGTITLNNSPPAANNGLIVDGWGTLNVNGGVIDIGPTGSLEVRGSPTVMKFNDGVINNAGSFTVYAGADFNYNGGAIVGNGSNGYGVLLDNADLTLGPLGAAPAMFTFFHGNNDLTGTVGAGHRIVIQGFGNTFDGDAYVTAIPDAANIFTNNGTITLRTVQDGQFVTLAELFVSGNPNTLVNNGMIEVLPASFATGEIETKLLENYGTITLSGSTTFAPASGVYRNRGTLTVASGGTLTLGNGNQMFEQLSGTLRVADDVAFVLTDISAFDGFPRFNFTGGAIPQGTVVVRNGYVSIAAGVAGRGHFTMWGGSTLQGEIGPNHTVVVEGSNRGAGGATMTTPSGQTLTNRGTLVIASPDANMTASLSLASGQLLVNEVGATFDVNTGNGQNPSIAAALRNKGVTNVRRSLTLGNNNDTHQNQTTGVFNLFNNAVVTFQGGAATPFTNTADAQSTGVVAGTGQLNVGSGRTFQNGGRVEPGGDAAAGTLTVTGNYTQTSGGTLDIELGGTGSGQFDRLAVTQQATLAGTMSVTLLPGYTPIVGHTFDVVTYTTRSGTFATINLPTLAAGLGWQTTYTATLVRLTVVNALADRPSSGGKPPFHRPIRR